MAWKQIVVRKDSPIRMYNITPVGITNKLNIFDHPVLKDVKFDKRVADHNGGFHVNLEQVFDFMNALITVSKTHPNFFQEIANRYEAYGKKWLEWLEKFRDKDFKSYSMNDLYEKCKTFFTMYRNYTPIMFVPFAVELRYKEEYPKFLEMMKSSIKRIITKKLNDESGLHLFYQSGFIKLQEDSTLMSTIKDIIETPSGRTFAENKRESQLKIAIKISKSNLQSVPNKISEIHNEEIRNEVLSSYDEFKWLKQWGYPPHFRPYEEEEYIKEIWKLVPTASLEIKKIEDRTMTLLKMKDTLLKELNLEEKDLYLINDISHYNFFRTWRMEVLIKAQFLSVPLLKEVEKRIKLKTDEIFFMSPPEILKLIKDGKIPDDLQKRRKLWFLQAEPKDSFVYSGEKGEYLYDKFISIMDFRENAKSIYIPDSLYVGGKGASLFRLVEEKLKIPPYFIVSCEAFSHLLSQPEVAKEFKHLKTVLEKLSTSEEDFKKIEELSDKIFMKSKIPGAVLDGINEALKEIPGEKFAVRSSASVEDSEKQSWAGRFKTHTFITKEDLIDAIIDIWKSIFSPPAIRYAKENQIDLTKVRMAVIVQTMIEPRFSGVVNTSYSKESPNLLELEMVHGEGEGLVSGEISPSTLIVDKSTFETKKKIALIQKHAYISGKLVELKKTTPVIKLLNNSILKRIIDSSIKIEKLFGAPQDIEFCIDASNNLWILQSRPITGISAGTVVSKAEGTKELKGPILARGLCGKVKKVVIGIAKVLSSPSEGDKFNDGEILITRAATPEWDSILYRASAVITNEGGSTCHAIRVANEQGYPAIVGTVSATSAIKYGSKIIVDTLSDPFEGKVRGVV